MCRRPPSDFNGLRDNPDTRDLVVGHIGSCNQVSNPGTLPATWYRLRGANSTSLKGVTPTAVLYRGWSEMVTWARLEDRRIGGAHRPSGCIN